MVNTELELQRIIKQREALIKALKEAGNILHQLGCDNAVEKIKQVIKINEK